MPMSSQPKDLIPQPFAAHGNYDIVPNDADVPGRASYADGFPQATQRPLREGGIAPNRMDFNGILHLLTAYGFWQQSGGQWTYATELNYTLPNVVYHDEKLWWCLRENGPDSVNGPHAPGTDESYWVELLTALGSMAHREIGGGFNTRQVITSSSSWTAPHTATIRYKIIGGGGAGGKGGGALYSDYGGGGAQGGSSLFAGIAAPGGSGGGGGGANGGGGGGGGAGEVVEGYLPVTEGQVVTVVVGKGALRTIGVATTPQKGGGPYGGDGGRPIQPGSGAAGASSGSSNSTGEDSGSGGPGGRNGTGYGGGGGGGGGYESVQEDGRGGAAADGAEYGGYGHAGRYGGAGGPGAVILEYYVREA